MDEEPVDDRTPAGSERSADGEPPVADEPIAIDAVLVPVDGSEESMHAVEYAVAIAERYDACVHALYVLDQDVARRIRFDEVDEADVAARGEQFMEAARARVPETVEVSHSTAYGFSPMQKSHHPGSVVLDAAADAAVDFIVIPREPPGGEPEAILSKAAEYVLQYASQPVLSV